MDARQRWELRKEAMAAVAGLSEPHKSECFNDFVKEEELDHATHQALWRELFLRQQSFAQKPAPHEPCCFCDKCVGPSEEADDETHNTAKKRLGLLVVYPDYDWVPPSPPKKDERPDPEAQQQQQQQKQKQQKQLEQLERAAHHYLQRLGRLPKPLPTVQWDGHRRLLPEEVRQHTRVLADSSITPDSLLEVVMSEAGRCEVLWILMCGHGAAEGLVLADGSRAALSRVAAALSKASFAGTVVVSLNTCQAELPGPQPYCGCSCSSMPASASTRLEPAGWHSELPFRWVVLHSCGYEPQKPSHAHHFARGAWRQSGLRTQSSGSAWSSCGLRPGPRAQGLRNIGGLRTSAWAASTGGGFWGQQRCCPLLKHWLRLKPPSRPMGWAPGNGGECCVRQLGCVLLCQHCVLCSRGWSVDVHPCTPLHAQLKMSTSCFYR